MHNTYMYMMNILWYIGLCSLMQITCMDISETFEALVTAVKDAVCGINSLYCIYRWMKTLSLKTRPETNLFTCLLSMPLWSLVIAKEWESFGRPSSTKIHNEEQRTRVDRGDAGSLMGEFPFIPSIFHSWFCSVVWLLWRAEWECAGVSLLPLIRALCGSCSSRTQRNKKRRRNLCAEPTSVLRCGF